MNDINEQDREWMERITHTLALLSQRQQLMDQWERQAAEPSASRKGDAANANHQSTPPLRRRQAIALSVAAALAICLTVSYTSRHAQEQQTAAASEKTGQAAPARGADPNDHIVRLLAQQDYAAALAAADSYEQELQPLSAATNPDATALSEEEAYYELLRQEQLYQLQWLRIEALVGLQRTDEATALLSTFAEREGDKQQQAKQLMESLGQVK